MAEAIEYLKKKREYLKNKNKKIKKLYNYKKELLDIFENDNSPLLNISSQTSSTTNEQKLIDIFNE